jgi:hypothetical protein
MGRQEVAPRRENAKKFHPFGCQFQRTPVQIPNQTISHVLFDVYKSFGINLSGRFGYAFAW